MFVPLPGVPEEAKNPCEEAPCDPSVDDHRTITFTLQDRQEGTLPLAVLRALRRGLPSPATAARCRRSATWTASSMWSSAPMSRTEPRTPLRDHLARLDDHRAADRDPRARPDARRPADGSDQAGGPGDHNDRDGRDRDARCCCWSCLYLIYAIIYFRQPPGAVARRPGRSRGRAHPDDLDHRHLADGARRSPSTASVELDRGNGVGSGSGPKPLTVPERAQGAESR